MKDDKKHLDIDLEFLDKKDGTKPKPPINDSGLGKDPTPTGPAPASKSDVETVDTGYKYNWKTILVIGGIALFFGWAIFSGSSDTSTNSTYTPPVVTSDSTVVPPVVITPTVKADTPVVPKVKTSSQICKSDYGSHSYATGEKNADGGPKCDCQTGYVWNDGQTACIVAPPAPKTGYEICQDRNGPNATYDSASNSCGCASGYSLSATTNQCVDPLVARDDSCAASYPGTSFLKYDTTSNKNICECKAGYNWNNDRTACYTTTSFNQSCVNTFGTGAYSTTENGKRVCDCGYGYSFNAQRNMCVTTASINAMCERDVGRNSRYDGTVTNGKYNCTEPY
jgi:hypothetical protein